MSSGRCTNEKPTRSACSATKSRSRKSLDVSGGRSSSVDGKLTPFPGFQPDALLARGVNLDLGPAGALRDDPAGRLAVVDEYVRPRDKLVDQLREIERKGDRLLGLFLQFVDQDEPVAAQQPRLRRRLDLEHAALGAGDVHQHLAGALEPTGCLTHVPDHPVPDFGVVVGAIDAGAIHACGDQVVDELGLGRRLRRQRRHDTHSRRAPRALAEHAVSLGLEFGSARTGEGRGRVGGVRLADQTAERRNQRVERRHDLCFTAPQGGEPARREPILEVGEVLAAQRDIMGEVDRPGGGLFRHAPPFVSQFRAPLLDVLAKRADLGQKTAQLFNVLAGFRRHVQPVHAGEASGENRKFAAPDRSLTCKYDACATDCAPFRQRRDGQLRFRHVLAAALFLRFASVLRRSALSLMNPDASLWS